MGRLSGFAAFKSEGGAVKDGFNRKELKKHPPLPDGSDLELYDSYFGGRARKELLHKGAKNYAGKVLQFRI